MQTFPREPEDIESVSTLWEDNCSFTTEDGAAELTQDQIARTLYVDKLRGVPKIRKKGSWPS